MTQTIDLIKKMSDFFTSEEYSEKREDARLELSTNDVKCICRIIKNYNVLLLDIDAIKAESEE